MRIFGHMAFMRAALTHKHCARLSSLNKSNVKPRARVWPRVARVSFEQYPEQLKYTRAMCSNQILSSLLIL